MNLSDCTTTDPRITRRAETTVDISRPVTAVTPMDWPRGQFQPTHIGVTYRHHHDEHGWCATGTVYGTRIRKDGTLGADDARVYVGARCRGEDPEWVTAFITAHRPAEVFDLRDPNPAAPGGTAAMSTHQVRMFAYPAGHFPGHIEINATGELIHGVMACDRPVYATLTAQPARAAGQWPVTYTRDSALKAAAQLLSYAHNYRARMTGSPMPDAAEVTLVAPCTRDARGSRWELGMAGITLRYATPATAFLDVPAVRSPRVLTDVTAERWAGALLALVVEMDQAHVVAEQAIHADRAGLTLTTEVRAWLDVRAGDLTAEQTDLARQLCDLLDAWDRAQARDRAAIAAGSPHRMTTATRSAIPAPPRARQSP